MAIASPRMKFLIEEKPFLYALKAIIASGGKGASISSSVRCGRRAAIPRAVVRAAGHSDGDRVRERGWERLGERGERRCEGPGERAGRAECGRRRGRRRERRAAPASAAPASGRGGGGKQLSANHLMRERPPTDGPRRGR
eukprot:scaffold148568_cov33-Tisochrysis_lutea.AAC.4